MDAPLNFSYDASNDVLTVEGVKYSGCVFRDLAIAKGGTYRITRDEGGAVVVMESLQGSGEVP